MPADKRKVSKTDIPLRSVQCPMNSCPYQRHLAGTCDSPRTNRGNSDAACHRINPVGVLTVLKLPIPTTWP